MSKKGGWQQQQCWAAAREWLPWRQAGGQGEGRAGMAARER